MQKTLERTSQLRYHYHCNFADPVYISSSKPQLLTPRIILKKPPSVPQLLPQLLDGW